MKTKDLFAPQNTLEVRSYFDETKDNFNEMHAKYCDIIEKGICLLKTGDSIDQDANKKLISRLELRIKNNRTFLVDTHKMLEDAIKKGTLLGRPTKFAGE